MRLSAILVKEALRYGVCKGIDKRKCVEALELIINEGRSAIDKVKALLGQDFGKFRENYISFFRQYDGGDEDENIETLKEEFKRKIMEKIMSVSNSSKFP